MQVRSWAGNFTKGEVSPEMEGRFDLSAYQVGLRTANNVRIRRTGGISKRMGTRFVAQSLSGTARLFPFQFSDDQAYVMEFGQAYMRPLALGGAILEEGLSVVSISNANPAVVQVAFHGYEVGDQVYFKDIEGMTEINDRFLTITAVGDDSHFTLDIDSTDFGIFSGSAGGTVRTEEPDPAPPVIVPPPLVTPPTPPIASGGGGGWLSDDNGVPVWTGRSNYNVP